MDNDVIEANGQDNKKISEARLSFKEESDGKQ